MPSSYVAVLILASAFVILAALFLIFEIYAVVIGHLKGAPFVRSGRKKIETMLELAEIQPGELVIDLGSGDGTLVIEGAARGASSLGIEINPFLSWYSRLRIGRAGFEPTSVRILPSKPQGIEKTARVVRADFRKYPLYEADVIFLYLWPGTIAKLKEKFSRELKPETRIISNGFPIQGWRPKAEKNGVFLYTVKDKV